MDWHEWIIQGPIRRLTSHVVEFPEYNRDLRRKVNVSLKRVLQQEEYNCKAVTGAYVALHSSDLDPLIAVKRREPAAGPPRVSQLVSVEDLHWISCFLEPFHHSLHGTGAPPTQHPRCCRLPPSQQLSRGCSLSTPLQPSG